MRRMLGRRGQSTAEYAVLFAIVIGAAIAMQQYVKTRLQGAIKQHADGYLAAQTGAFGGVPQPFEPDRATTSTNQSTSNVSMSSARTGTFNVDNTAKTKSTVTK